MLRNNKYLMYSQSSKTIHFDVAHKFKYHLVFVMSKLTAKRKLISINSQ